MTLAELRSLLAAHPEATLAIQLPDGAAVPPHFHVTEVGRVEKQFVDCGGGYHEQESCLLQVWVANDVDHRLTAGKLAGIAAHYDKLSCDDEVPLEVEYQVGYPAQFPVEAATLEGDTLRLVLAARQTDCLAKEACGLTPAGDAAEAGCCAPGSGCC